MSSAVFVIVAYVFLCRFDRNYTGNDGLTPVNLMIVASVLAVMWDIRAMS